MLQPRDYRRELGEGRSQGWKSRVRRGRLRRGCCGEPRLPMLTCIKGHPASADTLHGHGRCGLRSDTREGERPINSRSMTSETVMPSKPLDCVVAGPGHRSGRGSTSVAQHLANHDNPRILASGEGASADRRVDHTILVVNDVAAARYAAARVLRDAGFKTLEAREGAEALRLAIAASAVILDVHLPDIHGFEVCRLLRSDPATRSLPIMHVSAVYVSDGDKVKGESAGCDAYLVAPVLPELLIGTVERLLGISADHGASSLRRASPPS